MGSSSLPPWSPCLSSGCPSSVSSATVSKEPELEVVATALPHPATGLLHPTTELLPTDVATSPTTSRALPICSNRLPPSRAPPTTTVLPETELKTSTELATHRDHNPDATTTIIGPLLVVDSPGQA